MSDRLYLARLASQGTFVRRLIGPQVHFGLTMRRFVLGLVTLLATFPWRAEAPSPVEAPSWVPANVLPQADILKAVLNPHARAMAGWSTDDALYLALMGPLYRHCGEVFCGCGRMVTVLQAQGLVGFFMDIALSSKHNVLTDTGKITLVQYLLTVLPYGCVWFGLPCATWVWISRGHTLLSAKRVAGDTLREDVRGANAMVAFCCRLWDLLVLRHVYYIVEQPATSIVWKYAPFQRHVRRRPKIGTTKLHAQFLWLGHFGHLLHKATHLVGVFPGLKSIKTKRSRAIAPGKVGMFWEHASIRTEGPRKGTYRVQGVKKAGKSLSDSGKYPIKFCKFMASLIGEAVRCR